ncbi:uncharacterized protein LOC125179443 isoform X2 [Hyalella azteca]|uniref:Uncharacterized protein LOC125179443 isoform X2 n=1 Tax=Hyalella azteca TaxID=294128 RepID=A0A979FVI8_HYAAZ|nr:uncharacterized protein LOC125179443 isoform X2 [Hyalella azteca]
MSSVLLSVGRDEEDLRLVGARSTITAISITTITTTVPLTCLTAISTSNICRKKRKLLLNKAVKDRAMRDERHSHLDSSANIDVVTHDEGDEALQRTPRLALTLWTTCTSPFTFTSTSTNAALTFAVSFQCTFPGQSFPPACG